MLGEVTTVNVIADGVSYLPLGDVTMVNLTVVGVSYLPLGEPDCSWGNEILAFRMKSFFV